LINGGTATAIIGNFAPECTEHTQYSREEQYDFKASLDNKKNI
jgi:hypothetical protein